MPDKKHVSKTALGAAFIALSAIAGLIESFIPSPLFAIPGVKLGLANAPIACAFYFLGGKTAFLALICKIILVFIFSGNPVSLMFSVCGGLFSFLALAFLIRTYGKIFSFIGISAVCALFHAFGQLIAAFFLIGGAIIYYFFIICASSVIAGAFCGLLINLITAGTKNLFSAVKTAEVEDET